MTQEASIVECGRAPPARDGTARRYDDLASQMLEGIPRAILVTLQLKTPKSADDDFQIWIALNLRGSSQGKTMTIQMRADAYWIQVVAAGPEKVQRRLFEKLVKQTIQGFTAGADRDTGKRFPKLRVVK